MHCFKFFGLAAIGLLATVGSASGQEQSIPGTFVGATAGAGGNTTLVDGGEFATATGDEEGMWYDGSNTTGDGSRSLRTADGTSQIADSGGFRPFEIRNAFAIPILDSQIVTVIDGLTDGVTYDINVIYTAQWGHDDLRLAAGLTTTTAQVDDRDSATNPFGSWLDEGSEYNPSAEVGGSGPNASARVWFTNLGTAVATNGEIRVYVDNISSQFLSQATAYNGVSFSEVVAVTVLLGDVNLDETVNFLDISPFITALSSGSTQAEADVNEDDVVNFLDIAPFIGILSGQ